MNGISNTVVKAHSTIWKKLRKYLCLMLGSVGYHLPAHALLPENSYAAQVTTSTVNCFYILKIDLQQHFQWKYTLRSLRIARLGSREAGSGAIERTQRRINGEESVRMKSEIAVSSRVRAARCCDVLPGLLSASVRSRLLSTLELPKCVRAPALPKRLMTQQQPLAVHSVNSGLN